MNEFLLFLSILAIVLTIMWMIRIVNTTPKPKSGYLTDLDKNAINRVRSVERSRRASASSSSSRSRSSSSRSSSFDDIDYGSSYSGSSYDSGSSYSSSSSYDSGSSCGGGDSGGGGCD